MGLEPESELGPRSRICPQEPEQLHEPSLSSNLQGWARGQVQPHGSESSVERRIFIGIDVSKDKLDIAVKAAETGTTVSPAKRAAEMWTAANTTAGCAALVRRLQAMQPDRIAMEATGGYEQRVFRALREAGLPAVIVQPLNVRRRQRQDLRLPDLGEVRDHQGVDRVGQQQDLDAVDESIAGARARQGVKVNQTVFNSLIGTGQQ